MPNPAQRRVVRAAKEMTMAKIVYSPCYGGFGVSKKAAEFMAERGHAEARKELDDWKRRDDAVKHFLAHGRWPDHISDTEASLLAICAKYRKGAQWYGHFSDIDRSDPLLVAAVETLGAEANGEHANLKIEELPDGTKYRIDEYDGNESVMTMDDYNWSTA